MISPIRGNRPWIRVQVPLGHTICTYPADFGHGGTSPERRLTPVPGAQPADLRSSLPLGVSSVCGRGTLWVLACAADDGCHGFGGVCLQGFRPRVVGEGDLAGTQVADRLCVADWCCDVGSLPGAAPFPLGGGFRAGQADEQGRQVRQDVVLTDVEVLGPGGVRRAGAGIPVAAPVGRPAVRPAGLKPPPAYSAPQEPGQPVLATLIRVFAGGATGAGPGRQPGRGDGGQLGQESGPGPAVP